MMKRPSILTLSGPWALLAIAFLAACSNQETSSSSQPSGHPTYKVGNPYQVSGQWYYPHEDYSYDETGIASWYGSDFHGQSTSNGEIFNKNELTAAHKTLPLPSLARVTNLENGRSIVVRINDRGPFSGSRIIDLSQRAAQLLGFESKGTAQVRVTVLADESKAIADAMRHYGTGAAPQMVASAPEAVANGPPEQIVPGQQAPELVMSEANMSSSQPSSLGGSSTAPLTSVTSEALAPPANEVKTLEPVRTTPAVHQELLHTEPVQEVEQLPVGPHHIYVQAGAFTVKENAVKLQKQLASAGSVSVVQATVNGTTFYRVRVGPMLNVEAADTTLKHVKSLGADKPRTVVDQ